MRKPGWERAGIVPMEPSKAAPCHAKCGTMGDFPSGMAGGAPDRGEIIPRRTTGGREDLDPTPHETCSGR